MNYKHSIGDLIIYHAPTHLENPMRMGIVVDIKDNLYIRYRVQWFEGGFNHFNEHEITTFKRNFKNWLT